MKTITIDFEAYEALARRKRKGESFSRVIKERFGSRRTGRDLAALVKSMRLTDETPAVTEKLVRNHGHDRDRAPRLRSTSRRPS
jgi:predicted CopG family antitoxin